MRLGESCLHRYFIRKLALTCFRYYEKQKIPANPYSSKDSWRKVSFLTIYNDKFVMKKYLILAAVFLVAGVAQNSFAGSAVSTLNPKIIVAAVCTATTASGQNFGIHAATSPDLLDATAGQVTVQCPLGVSYRVCFNGGNYALPSAKMRRMLRDGNTNYMKYNLKYMDSKVGDSNAMIPLSTKTARWAPGILDIGTGNPSGQTYKLTADVIITSASIAGTYRDTVAATVYW